MTRVLVERVHRSILERQLLSSGSRVLVAVSGGADSVALLHVLHALSSRLKLHLRAAHLDHGLRPESADDALFVGKSAATLRIPATIERREVAALSAEQGWSVEDGARRIRYQFLAETARRYSMGVVALAHTADDQAETVLMRLMRGTGLTGLAAIPAKRGLDEAPGERITVVRPLLETWRRDIVSYLQEEGIAYREDASNCDQRFLRNRIRHHLLPLLEKEYNPNVKGALNQLAEQSGLDQGYLQEATERQLKRVLRPSGANAVSLDIAAFRRQPTALQRQMVRHAIRRVRGDLQEFEFRHWREIVRLFADRPAGSIVHLPGGIELVRERVRVICRRAAGPASP
jgi:tRNA(Ile)-lysidine synthase